MAQGRLGGAELPQGRQVAGDGGGVVGVDEEELAGVLRLGGADQAAQRGEVGGDGLAVVDGHGSPGDQDELGRGEARLGQELLEEAEEGAESGRRAGGRAGGVEAPVVGGVLDQEDRVGGGGARVEGGGQGGQAGVGRAVAGRVPEVDPGRGGTGCRGRGGCPLLAVEGVAAGGAA
ncbi:hypothetical protein G6541_29495 [Streptomyces albidoflavus]|nr:hypothetical protein [Streptomyces albidoflavus]